MTLSLSHNCGRAGLLEKRKRIGGDNATCDAGLDARENGGEVGKRRNVTK